MDKWQAIHSFWSDFELPAYDQSSVPFDAQLPYITYNAAVGDFENAIPLTASIWYRSPRWAEISQKEQEIARKIGRYKILKLDDGYLYIVKGNPFAQRMTDEDDGIKRVYIILQAEFLTT